MTERMTISLAREIIKNCHCPFGEPDWKCAKAEGFIEGHDSREAEVGELEKRILQLTEAGDGLEKALKIFKGRKCPMEIHWTRILCDCVMGVVDEALSSWQKAKLGGKNEKPNQ